MKIVEVREQSVSIRSEISNAYISFAEMTVSAAVIITDVVRDGRPVVGYGFNSNGRYAQSGIIRDRLIPRLMQAPARNLLNDAGTNFDPFKAWQIMMSNEKPGGHGERCVGVGVLDMAFWDVVAKIEDQPLYRLLANWFRKGEPDKAVYVYGAGGYYYPGKELSGLRDEMRRYLDLGYDTVKMKIGGAPLEQDLKRIEAVLHLVPSGRHLAVDANGRFDLATATRYARAIEPYDLKWYEEPGDPLDFELNREVGLASSTPIATGENLFSVQDARNLIRYGGMKRERDCLQMDPALSYGLVEYLRTLEMLAENGWSTRRCIPHGGHQFALHIAAGLGLGGAESYPGIFEPFGGFADDIPVEQGRVRPSETPGIGVEAKPELMKIYEHLSA
ncbi:MAG: mandelate racemase/muconate lactonizing enzyme family protein [Bryobacterales bacterium]|nr:mandelate racemase/muconate lactonizing enzyme family protein [Bryobacterales bacterium]